MQRARTFAKRMAAAVWAAAIPSLCACETLPQADLDLKMGKAGWESGNQFITVRASGAWTLRLDGVETGGDEVGWAWLTAFGKAEVPRMQTDGTGDCVTWLLNWGENHTGGTRSCTLVLTPQSGAAQSFTFRQGTESAVPDYPSVLTPDPVPGWMELPQADLAGCCFVTHPMTMGDRDTRNFSVCWAPAMRVAPWVAYPLNSSLIGSSTSRTEAWNYDPKFPVAAQPCYFKGISGYHRGHQLPSADRKGSRAINAATFYFTNMTPQLGPFNTGIWERLEARVRTWASSVDTLYVVTGCVVGDDPEYARDNNGEGVAVPAAYFKALLAYGGKSSAAKVRMSRFVSTGYYAAIGFYLPHTRYASTDAMPYALSIDELEELLGYELFPNLPEATATTVEAAAETSWWESLKP